MDYYRETEKILLRYYRSKDELSNLQLELKQISLLQAVDNTKEKVSRTNLVRSGIESQLLHQEKLENKIMKLESFIKEIDIALNSLRLDQREVIKKNYASKKYKKKKYYEALESLAIRLFGIEALYFFEPEMKAILRI